MLTRLKERATQSQALRGGAWRARHRLQRLGLAAAGRIVSGAPGHEVLVVFGMRRSGNHAVISWILGQVRGSAAFYNNIDPERHPFTARMTEFRLRARNPSPRLVLSYEDVAAAELAASRPLTDLLAERAARGAAVRFALILRDPLNLFASRLKKWPGQFAGEAMIAAQRRLYLDHARLALAPAPIWRDAPLAPILFNDFVAEPAARDRAAGLLGLARGDRGLDAIPVYGHGSSFDGTGDGTGEGAPAIRARVFSRWQSAAGDPAFRQAVDDDEIRAIARDPFGLAG